MRLKPTKCGQFALAASRRTREYLTEAEAERVRERRNSGRR
jgi:hypothetical protein